MCGIAGIIHYNNAANVDEQKLTICRDALIHRGPDFGANYIYGNVGLAHRRLSIIDLSTNGNQPLLSKDENYVIVFNGEIYNFKELKIILQKKGFTFYSNSDTEVLLNMYICFGKNMLQQLSGMFAFAILDKQKNELFVARDRVGIKPLYYAEVNNSFVFASEPKALLKAYVNFEIQTQNLNELLLYRFVSGSESLFKNIYKLVPGHFMVVTKDGIKENTRWWNLKNQILQHSTITKPVEWFFETFNNSVKSHMISDVPVGVLLSGGLDSSSICASLKYQGFNDINTFNVGFTNFIDDETLIANEVANKYNYPFHNIIVESEDLYKYSKQSAFSFGDALIHQNEPQLVAISSFANKYVKVLLSGEGADELMGGYVRYKAFKYFENKKAIGLSLRITPNFFKSHRLKKLQHFLNLQQADHAILFNAVNNFPKELMKMGIETIEIKNEYRVKILEEAKELYANNLVRQAMYLDQHTYLSTLNDRNDIATMQASIECRVPFLDHKLIEGLGTLPNDFLLKGNKGKYILNESFKTFLPKSVLKFRKVGFSVPWVQHLKQNETLLYGWNTMEKSEILNMGVLKLLNIQQLRSEYNNGDTSKESLLRQLFFISFWYNNYKQSVNQYN